MASYKDLSPEQKAVVDSWGQALAVRAGAGSGKTTTLVIKCEELLKNKPDARIAAVSFTEKSASDLREKLSQRLLDPARPELFARHWVTTIHGLCAGVIGEFPHEAGLDGEESILNESESEALWERVFARIWSDTLDAKIIHAVDTLLERESQSGLADLLKRVRSLRNFNVLEVLKKSTDPITRDLAMVAESLFTQYDELKEKEGGFDFDDLERRADRALNEKKVRQYYQKRFDLVLVDEFQDTNPLQAEIIWRFVRPDLSNLCVVGDPKQSIYRFRDADLSVFNDLCERIENSFSLNWNFRSRPQIIHFVNRLCKPLFEASAMQYEPLEPRRQALAGNAVVKVEVQEPADLVRWVRAKNQNGTPLHEMAILLRRIRGNEHWLKAFVFEGIPIAVGSGGLFWEDPRVRELVAFLKWWFNPAHRLSGAVFLRAPWVGVSDRDLDTWIGEDSSLLKPFLNSDHPIARRLKPLHGSALRPGEILLELLVNEDLESQIGASLLGLWHRAEELSLRGLHAFEVIAELQRSCERSRREADVPPPRNLGQLNILTIHSAKGLEFPQVILVDFEGQKKPPNAPLLFWDRHRGAFLGKRSEDGGRPRKDPVEEKWRKLETSKNIDESKRLFYVALTRAQEKLILVLPKTTPRMRGKPPASPLMVDYWLGWVEAFRDEIANDPIPEAPASQPRALPQKKAFVCVPRSLKKENLKRSRHSVSEWNLLHTCARAYEWQLIRPHVADQWRTSIGGSKKSQLSASELGSRVHQAMETLDFQALRKLEEEVGPARFRAGPLVDWIGNREWMNWKNHQDDCEIWSELAFEVRVGEEILVGAVDRLIRKADDYWLLDFKVTEKAKTPAELLQTYQTQIELYGWALSQLEPKLKHHLKPYLVQITPAAVQEVKVPWDFNEVEKKVTQWAVSANSIIAGQPGLARPGGHCRSCDFLKSCAPKVSFHGTE